MITLTTESNNDDFMVGNINVSPQHNTLTHDDHTCRLQPKAMAVLHYLAKNKDRVINNDELLDQVWQGRVVTYSSIQKCVNAIRSAFSELDSNFDYVVYFSKRGYQLITPTKEYVSSVAAAKTAWLTPFVSMALLFLTVIFSTYLFYPFNDEVNPLVDKKQLTVFTQVKPYVSNTGREQIIEPHYSSERVAFIRNEVTPEIGSIKSYLFIQDTKGQQWQVSVARGNFVNLAWSPSGRNLVVIDAHNDKGSLPIKNEKNDSANYHTLHIFTFDFKAEKIIEKNILSHWHGDINSISWWDEATLEFTATQGEQVVSARYRYGIAEQNLSTLKTTNKGKLLSSQILNKKTAILSLIGTGEEVQFIDKNQQVINSWPIPLEVISMNWLADEKGVILLSADNKLSILYVDGHISSVDYSPIVNGKIMQVRSNNNGNSIVLTVDSSTAENDALLDRLQNVNSSENNSGIFQQRLLTKGGGFIYSSPKGD